MLHEKNFSIFCFSWIWISSSNKSDGKIDRKALESGQDSNSQTPLLPQITDHDKAALQKLGPTNGITNTRTRLIYRNRINQYQTQQEAYDSAYRLLRNKQADLLAVKCLWLTTSIGATCYKSWFQ